MSCEAHACLFECQKALEGSFHHCGSPVKFVQASMSIQKGPQTRFYQCCGPVTAFWIFSETQTDVNTLHRTSTVVKMALWIIPHIQNGLHNLPRTFTLVETAFKVLPERQMNHPERQIDASQDLSNREHSFLNYFWQSGVRFTRPPQWRKRLSMSFLTH